MAEEKKRIIILTADAGFGHRSAANALAAALEKDYPNECEIFILNPLDDQRAPAFLRNSAADYDRLVDNAPELYRFGYNASDSEVPNFLIESLLTVSLFEIMGDMVRDINPDVIVTTYPVYQAPLISYFTITRYCVPLITVVTDLVSVHRLWFSPEVENCLVPTTEVKNLALKYGVADGKIHITGIPVSPAFTENRKTKAELRAELGWEKDLLTFLAVGSRRVDHFLDILNVLNHFSAPMQVIALAGKEEKLHDRLQAIDWHVPARVHGLVDRMSDFLLAADAVICKAGGLIVTESLACGLPMLLIDVIPGQEEGNCDYVVKNGAGVMVTSPVQMLETLSHWMADDGLVLKSYAEASCRIGKPDSASNAAALVWQAAQSGPVNNRVRTESGRTRLIDLLTRHNIPWQDAQDERNKSK